MIPKLTLWVKKKKNTCRFKRDLIKESLSAPISSSFSFSSFSLSPWSPLVKKCQMITLLWAPSGSLYSYSKHHISHFSANLQHHRLILKPLAQKDNNETKHKFIIALLCLLVHQCHFYINYWCFAVFFLIHVVSTAVTNNFAM